MTLLHKSFPSYLSKMRVGRNRGEYNDALVQRDRCPSGSKSWPDRNGMSLSEKVYREILSYPSLNRMTALEMPESVSVVA